MEKKLPQFDLRHLPRCAGEYIKLVIKKMRYRKQVRADVLAELASDFEEELKEYTSDDQKQQTARQLIEEFDEVKLLAALLRRAKKRCRPLWRTVVARTFQVIGVLILCFIIYVVWFLSGEPSISVDYLALLNQRDQPQVRDEDNAWPHYEKAIELFVEPSQSMKEVIAISEAWWRPIYRSFAELSEETKQEIKNGLNRMKQRGGNLLPAVNKNTVFVTGNAKIRTSSSGILFYPLNFEAQIDVV